MASKSTTAAHDARDRAEDLLSKLEGVGYDTLSKDVDRLLARMKEAEKKAEKTRPAKKHSHEWMETKVKIASEETVDKTKNLLTSKEGLVNETTRRWVENTERTSKGLQKQLDEAIAKKEMEGKLKGGSGV